MIKRAGVYLTLLWLLLAAGITLAQTNQPTITSFGSSVTRLDKATVEARGGLVPVYWDTANRPANSNLVFEQLLADGRVMNVELPRRDPIVPSAGNGVVFPFPPGEGVNEVRFRVSLIDLNNGKSLNSRELIIPLGDNSAVSPTITVFSTSETSVAREALSKKTARIPVSFGVDNRPNNSNLVFEQVLDDNSVVNVELPRTEPIIPSAGIGVVAPNAPKQAATKTITLRLRLVNLGDSSTLAQKDITVAVTDVAVVVPTIKTFSTSATNVDGNALADKSARLPVTFAVDNRPTNSNLVFEQVLDDGSVVNAELPRTNPIVPSSGVGMVAPVSPKDPNKTSITLRLRLVDLGAGQATLAEQTITVPIVTAAVNIKTFSSAAVNIGLPALSDKSARIFVAFAVENRPPNSNLVFEQVLDDGSVINVELPRGNPIVPSSGSGVVAPVAPKNAATNSITLRLRVINLTTQNTLAQQSFTVPIAAPPPPTPTSPPPPTPVPGTVSITTFSTNAQGVARQALVSNTARVPVVFAVENRPANSNLVFEQLLDNNTLVNIELPRQDPVIPSSGNGLVAPVAPVNTSVNTVTLRLRVKSLNNDQTVYAQKDITLPIIEAANAPTIRVFTTTAQNVDNTALTNRTARVPVSWDVVNRPANSNLLFEQVMETGSVINVELPRSNPIVPSSGNGVVAPVPPLQAGTRSIALRLRLVDLGNNSTITQSELSLPISGRPGMPEGVWNQTSADACFSNGFPASNGLAVNGTGQVNANVPNGRIFVSTAVRSGTLVGELLPNSQFTVLEGPSCWKVSGSSTEVAYLRLWRVRATTGSIEGWISEYEMDLSNGTTRAYVSAAGTSNGGSGNTGSETVTVTDFTVTPDPASRGGAVTINWTVTGPVSTVKVIRLSEFGGDSVETILDQQPATGSAPYTLPAEYLNSATFQLSVSGTNGQESIQNVTINLTCPFSNTLQSGTCPATQTEAVDTVFQTFEKGLMLWRSDNKKIYVFYGDATWQEFNDTWNGEPNPSTDEVPQGLIKPENGFGKIWYEIGGLGVLGWATAPESAYSAHWEMYPVTDAGQMSLAPTVTLQDGRVIVAGLVWQYQ
ncbi:MAG: hypothetical protein R3E39_15065 [Anaerolineae bacterium]